MPQFPGINYEHSAQFNPVVPGSTQVNVGSDNTGAAISQLGDSLTKIGGFLEESYVKSVASKYLSDKQTELADYSRQLNQGGMDEDGKLIPPAKPNEVEALYKKKVQDLNSGSENDLAFNTQALFQDQFSEFASRQGVAVKAQAVDRLQGEAKANMDEALDKDATNFVDAPNLAKPSLKAQAFGKIDQLVNSGIYSPEEGVQRKRRYEKEVGVASMTKMLRAPDPTGNSDTYGPDLVIAAIDRGEFDEMRVEDREHWKSVAFERKDSMTRAANAKRDRDERKAEKLEKDNQTEWAKDAWAKQAKGDLDIDWLLENQDNFAKDDFHMLLKAGRGQDEGPRDENVYGDLRMRVSRGEDVRSDTIKARRSGLIRAADEDRLFEISESKSVATQASNPGKRGEDFISHYLVPDPAAASGFEKSNMAKALDEWFQTVKEHPDWTSDKLEREYHTIADSYLLINKGDIRTNLPVPHFVPGGRGAVNVESLGRAYQEMDKAFKEGKIDQKEMLREAKRINDWRKVFPSPTATATPKAK